jgi:hypothetical protein
MEWYKVEWHIEANSQEEANKKRDEALAALSRHQAGTANDLLLAGAIGAGIALFAKAVTAPSLKMRKAPHQKARARQPASHTGKQSSNLKNGKPKGNGIKTGLAIQRPKRPRPAQINGL